MLLVEPESGAFLSTFFVAFGTFPEDSGPVSGSAGASDCRVGATSAVGPDKGI